MKPTAEELSLIQEEEQELEKVYLSLRLQAQHGSERLKTETSRSRDLTAELVAARRAEDKQMLASDESVSHRMREMKEGELRDLDKLLGNPYFARVVVEERSNGKPRTIQYKLGLRSNVECRIIDWRKGPIAKLYYEYAEGEEYAEEILGQEREGVILTRNKVRIENGELLEVSNRLGTFVRTAEGWMKSQSQRRGAKGRMPDVLSLITAEQFQSITTESDTAVLLQGVAGSGKTTVALHRLSWLLHENNSRVEEHSALVVVKSPVLARYIEGSLQYLGAGGVPVLTYQRFVSKVLQRILRLSELKRPNTAQGQRVRWLKASLPILKRLEQYVSGQNKWVIAYLRENLQPLDPKIETALEEQQILEEPVIAFLQSLRSRLHQLGQSGVEHIDKLLKGLGRYHHDILEILRAPQPLLSLDESNFLDEEDIQVALEATEDCFHNGQIDTSDDPLFLLLHFLKTGSRLTHSGLSSGYEHIVIDELQDYQPLELAAVLASAKKRDHITLAGDRSQDMNERGAFIGWHRLQEHWKLEGAKYIELSISHRSTADIMRFATAVSGQRTPVKGRRGKPPMWRHYWTEEKGLSSAIYWLEKVVERFPESLVAVLCHHQDEARYASSLLKPTFGEILRLGDEDDFDFEEGIVVTDVATVKGLEFPSVLIWNPVAKHYPNTDVSRRKLYVAATRAENNLCLITWEKPSPVLPSIHSKLVRGIEEERD